VARGRTVDQRRARCFGVERTGACEALTVRLNMPLFGRLGRFPYGLYPSKMDYVRHLIGTPQSGYNTLTLCVEECSGKPDQLAREVNSKIDRNGDLRKRNNGP
jgi:hypothetical protein